MSGLLNAQEGYMSHFFDGQQSLIPNDSNHQLIVIGNGFDLACGIKSGFASFFNPRMRALGACRVNLCLGRYVFDTERRGSMLHALRENSDWFKAHGLSTCAWLWAFWGEDGASPPFPLITDRNGRPGDFFCPMDETFRKFAAEYVADIARTGVDMILYDDDYGYRNMFPGQKISCLCERHLTAYSKELGEDVSPDEFGKRVSSGGSNRWRDA